MKWTRFADTFFGQETKQFLVAMHDKMDQDNSAERVRRSRHSRSNKFATTLRLRWLWHEWASPDKLWVGMEVPCTDDERQHIASCTTIITLGNGTKANFWSSAWLHGQCPLLFNNTRCKKCSMAKAVHDNAWIRDLNYRSGFIATHLLQFVVLWNLVAPTELIPQ
jgi:hypothetical protein